MAIIRSNLLKLMSQQDRKEFGKAGMLPEEIAHKAHYRDEIEMHDQFASWLNRIGLCQYIHASPNRKVRDLPPGWPDFTIFGPIEKVFFLEFKTTNGKLSEDQERVMLALACLGHIVHIPRSYEEARDITGKHFGLF